MNRHGAQVRDPIGRGRRVDVEPTTPERSVHGARNRVDLDAVTGHYGLAREVGPDRGAFRSDRAQGHREAAGVKAGSTGADE
jgi:hypothetical protein